jgi:hypothetical protein
MRVLHIPTAKPINACVKFDYKGYEISLSTDSNPQRPWLAVFNGESNSPLFICEQADMLDAIDQAKAFIDAAIKEQS